jgi:hypothetical protein
MCLPGAGLSRAPAGGGLKLRRIPRGAASAFKNSEIMAAQGKLSVDRSTKRVVSCHAVGLLE